MNKATRTILLSVGAVAIVVLAIVLYNSILKPVKFNQEYERRQVEVVNKLKDIRTLQEQYKNTHNAYCNDIDSLIDFALNGEAWLIQKFGTVPDNMTEAQAIKEGKLRRDTTKVNPLEKLYAEGKLITKREDIKDLKIIPFSDGKTFEMQAGTLDKGGIEVAVFEAKAPIETYTLGMDEQTVINMKAANDKTSKGSGLKVGSMEQAITDGNWE